MGAQGSKAGSYLEGNCARANEALAVYAAAFAAAHCALVWMTSTPRRPALAQALELPETLCVVLEMSHQARYGISWPLPWAMHLRRGCLRSASLWKW